MKKFNPWLYWLLVALVGRWIHTEVSLYQLRHRLANLWVYTIHLRIIDETSGAPLAPLIGHPSSDENHLPFVLQGDFADGVYEYIVTSDQPVSFRCSSPGYSEKWVTVSKDSSRELEIRLTKK